MCRGKGGGGMKTAPYGCHFTSYVGLAFLYPCLWITPALPLLWQCMSYGDVCLFLIPIQYPPQLTIRPNQCMIFVLSWLFAKGQRLRFIPAYSCHVSWSRWCSSAEQGGWVTVVVMREYGIVPFVQEDRKNVDYRTTSQIEEIQDLSPEDAP